MIELTAQQTCLAAIFLSHTPSGFSTALLQADQPSRAAGNRATLGSRLAKALLTVHHKLEVAHSTALLQADQPSRAAGNRATLGSRLAKALLTVHHKVEVAHSTALMQADKPSWAADVRAALGSPPGQGPAGVVWAAGLQPGGSHHCGHAQRAQHLGWGPGPD